MFLALLVCLPALASEPLPALRADASGITASGLSSGGYMAVQLHVAYSASVKGVAAVAAGPYYCAQGSVWTAQYNCMAPGWWTPLPRAAYLKSFTDAFAASGKIDPPKNLAAAPAWLFTGTRDRTVDAEVVRELERFYALYGVKAALVGDKPAGHGMVVEQAKLKCAETASPFIVDCDYDAAGNLLKHLLGQVQPPAQATGGQLRKFDQRPFGSRDISMSDAGFVFVPKACETEKCRIHIAFHGCRQNAEGIGEEFVRNAGYNRWADTNRLIVLYPQTVARWWPVYNPKACWDWWGYTGAGYATKDGAQLRAVMAMVARLAAQ